MAVSFRCNQVGLELAEPQVTVSEGGLSERTEFVFKIISTEGLVKAVTDTDLMEGFVSC